MRTVAVDWSGSVAARGRTTWVAEVADDELVFLECGRSAAEIAELLVAWAREDAELVVGLDFAFALPLWWMRERGCASALQLWRDAAGNADAWLRECPPPFWGRAPQLKRPQLPEGAGWYRATEELLSPVAGTRPKSVFQISGAGSVGTGSLRGMALLAALHDAGFSVWPFDPPSLPRAVEIWPRLLTGAVRKSDPAARRERLDALGWPRDAGWRALVASTEDAFDAALAARAMAQHAASLRDLGMPKHPHAAVEGWIWAPPQ
jgi:hypothetical protein